jgi:excisionase family DNA binding protein
MNAVAELPMLLTPTEVCRALRISRSTLGRMVDRGDLQVVRLGRPGAALRIPAQELQRLVDQTSVSAAAARLLGRDDGGCAPTKGEKL